MSLHRPESLDAALALMRAPGAVVLAGGTDLYPALRDGPPPGEMVDLTRVAGLRGVTSGPEGWRIGAATTWSELLRADLPPLFDGLRAAAREVGSVQIQNAGTVAGNLCNASPAADGVPALLALDAEVALQSETGTRRLPLDAFITGPRATALRPGEIVTAVHVPAAEGRGAFRKLGARRYLVISIAMVAATVETEAGRIARARIAVGACSPAARRLPDLESVLSGKRLSDVPEIAQDYPFPELAPIGDVRAPAAYRDEAVRILVTRTLVDAMAEEAAHVA
ncbi:xanthine dehydrogenase family protein subunit M [Salipiger sp. P9]|uniref:FAD binding domain-containing protein n=1 Tax=Salipiger pentaromativorans TaxID=2943193 RepID=UPI0021580BE8|nr:xanthine dehydrogenase family protein subunit M [Salipiger pentaromativorans]MCR8546333.1 xanthine dehydrogenase family protein subunit M [Salipiger pentaromativorans]